MIWGYPMPLWKHPGSKQAYCGYGTNERTKSQENITMFGFSAPISGTQKQGTF
jgi:hypothetical protein